MIEDTKTVEPPPAGHRVEPLVGRSLCGFFVGDRVRAVREIIEDANDHHPRSALAYRGDKLVIRDIDPESRFPIRVSHERIVDQSFGVEVSEIEPAN